MHWKVRSRSAAPSCSPDQTPAMRRASSAASSSSRVRVRVRPTASRGSLDRETKRPAGAAVVRGASVTRSQPTRCHIGASPTAPMSHRVGTGRHGPGCGAGKRSTGWDRISLNARFLIHAQHHRPLRPVVVQAGHISTTFSTKNGSEDSSNVPPPARPRRVAPRRPQRALP